MNGLRAVKDLPNQDGFEFRGVGVGGYVFPAVVKLDSDGIHRAYITRKDDNGNSFVANPETAKVDISTLAGWFPLEGV